MKGLFIIPYIPYPLDSGGNQAFFSMIDYLKQDNEIHIIIPVPDMYIEKLRALKKVWGDICFHPYFYRNEPSADFSSLHVTDEEKQYYHSLFFNFINYLSASSKRKIARYRKHHPFISDNCGTLVKQHTLLYENHSFLTEGFLKHVKDTAANGNYDFIQVEFYELLPLYKFLPDNILKIFVHHELRFIRLDNELALFTDATLSERLQAERIKQQEIAMLNNYDYVITLTDNDKNILSEYIPEDKIRVSPATVVTGAIKPKPFSKCSSDFVFTGSNSHFPNFDGVVWLCTEILPHLRMLMDDFRVHIVGNWDKRTVRLIEKKHPEVHFAGFVEDLHSFLSGKISIVPIRIGSGMRMKILDAINSSSPVITTSKGIEGLDFKNEYECMISDDAESFAAAMYKLSNNTDIQQTLEENASRKLYDTYRPDMMMKTRKALYSEFLDHKEH